MTGEEIEQAKSAIDQMSRIDMARLWRFHSGGHPYFREPLAVYFKTRFDSLGGFNPDISKAIGWG